MWLSFVVLAVNIGLIGYSFWLGHLADAEVPELSYRVDTAVAMAARDDGFTDRLIWASKVGSFQGDGRLALAPVVVGAEVRSFSASRMLKTRSAAAFPESTIWLSELRRSIGS